MLMSVGQLVGPYYKSSCRRLDKVLFGPDCVVACGQHHQPRLFATPRRSVKVKLIGQHFGQFRRVVEAYYEVYQLTERQRRPW